MKLFSLAFAVSCVHPAPTTTATPTTSGMHAIYLVMVDRFENGNPDNDQDADPSDPAAFHGGDLNGLTARLDHISDLGFDTVWITPIGPMQTDPIGEHGAFHGYWPMGEAGIEPRFGDMAQLRKLTDALEQRGMGLLIDQVLNHVAPRSPLRETHPGWFHTHGDIIDWTDGAQLQTHDVHGLPDLIQADPAVSGWLIEHGRWWMEQVEPSGFRLDAVRHMSPEFVAKYAAEMRAVGGPNTVILGEIYDGNPVRVARESAAAGLSHVFDFPLHHALIEGLCEGGDLRKIAAVLTQDTGYANPHKLVTFLDNHDRPRIRTACGEDNTKVHDAITLLTSLRGIPSFSWGTEAEITGHSETEARADMVFEPTPTTGVLRTRLAQRASSPALSRGETDVLRSEAGVLAFARVSPDEAIVVQLGDDQPPPLPKVAGEVRWTPVPSGNGQIHRWRLQGVKKEQGFSAWRDALLARRVTRVGVRFTVEQGPVWIVGSDPALGGWNPQQAVGPIPAGGAVTVHLPVGGTTAVKLIQKTDSGDVQWSDQDNTWVVLPHTSEEAPNYPLVF